MKKEYKAPIMSKVIMEVEYPMMNESQSNEADSKKNGTEFVDEGEIAVPETPKKFWDDEE